MDHNIIFWPDVVEWRYYPLSYAASMANKQYFPLLLLMDGLIEVYQHLSFNWTLYYSQTDYGLDNLEDTTL